MYTLAYYTFIAYADYYMTCVCCARVCLCVFVCVCLSLRADSDRAAPHANAAYHGEGVPARHAGGASAGPVHRVCHVPLPGPVDQDTLPFPVSASSAAQQQPAIWIQPQLHNSPAWGHTTRAGLYHTKENNQRREGA